MGEQRVRQRINRTEHAENVEAGTGGLRGTYSGQSSGAANESERTKDATDP